jgi:hypothetical protein
VSRNGLEVSNASKGCQEIFVVCEESANSKSINSEVFAETCANMDVVTQIFFFIRVSCLHDLSNGDKILTWEDRITVNFITYKVNSLFLAPVNAHRKSFF